MTDLDRISVLESRGAPGVFLAMAWAASSAELTRVLSAWAVEHPAVTVVAAAGREAEVAELSLGISGVRGWTWVVAKNVTEDARITCSREVFLADGWTVSPAGAAAWAAARKIGGVRLVIDFSSPRLPLRLPAGTRVGGIIIPQ
jgi:hypothetical protein